MRSPILNTLVIPMLSVLCCATLSSPAQQELSGAQFDILVFSKTAGFRHGSITAGKAALIDLGRKHRFNVDTTEDASWFQPATLEKYQAVVFLNTTGDVLNEDQQRAFEAYIAKGNGYVGVHAAADTEYDWPWYANLVGAYFKSHPAIQPATIKVTDRVHPATRMLPQLWERIDEWYTYRDNPRGNVHVLAVLDESTYEGGEMGHDHPIAWCHTHGGGRSFYTGGGHTNESYSEPTFLYHLLGGIRYAAGLTKADDGATIPDNYKKTVLDTSAFDPMELDIDQEGRIYYVQRAGELKMYDPQDQSVSVIGMLNVFDGTEDGLLGLALDPNFSTNNWLYMIYSPAGEIPKNHVSRFDLVDGQLDLSSEQVVLEFVTQRDECCHAGGSLEFDAHGNLFISTGDNTNPFASDGFAPIDEREGRSPWDAQKSSSNTNDLRGKILRITPQPDGTYTIPEGNLFPADGSKGRPEIYVMGCRNPFRISIDSKTGWLYFGDVGPDAGTPGEERGPAGHDEFNQAKTAGNFGWPHLIADNKPYWEYDFTTEKSRGLFDARTPINNSPNNTGEVILPHAQPAWIYYPYSASELFPELGAGGRTAMAGPVYYYDPLVESDGKLPQYFDKTLFIYEWSRNWIREVKLDSEGNIVGIFPFADQIALIRPMDMLIGSDGVMYLLEWGTDFGGKNRDAKLVRIDYRN